VADHDFIGAGLAFPMRVDARGSLAMSSGPDALEQALVTIISTAPGERVMRPAFGCAIWDLLFDPVTPNTLGLMCEAVRDAVSRWEPRVELDDVVAVPDPERPELVRISVRYTVRTTNDKRNLVYPFYVIPQEHS
jgi:uncharacterized protein